MVIQAKTRVFILVRAKCPYVQFELLYSCVQFWSRGYKLAREGERVPSLWLNGCVCVCSSAGASEEREREMGSGASRYLLANWSVGPFDLFWPMAWGTSRPYTSNTIFPVSSWETGYPPANWISAWTPHPPYPGHGAVSCLMWHLSLGRLWQVLTEYPGRVFAWIRAGQIYFSLCVRTGVEGGHVPDFPGPPWRSAFTRGASRFSGDPYPRVAWAILWGSGEADPLLQGSGVADVFPWGSAAPGPPLRGSASSKAPPSHGERAVSFFAVPPGPSAVLLGLNRFVSLIY